MTITRTYLPGYPTFTSPEDELAERICRIPVDAACRGFYINMLDAICLEYSPALQAAYRERFPNYRVTVIRFHPISDYIRRLFFIAQQQWGLPGVYQGIGEIQGRANAAFFQTLIGKTVKRFMEDTPAGLYKYCNWLNNNRQVILNYGRWSFVLKDDGIESINFVDEYVYIDYAMVGGFTSVARAFGLELTAQVEMRTMFDGTVSMKFKPLTGGR